MFIEPPEWEDFDEDEDVMDLRANHALGGVFHFNLMTLPPQPKTVNNWVITRCMQYQLPIPVYFISRLRREMSSVVEYLILFDFTGWIFTLSLLMHLNN